MAYCVGWRKQGQKEQELGEQMSRWDDQTVYSGDVIKEELFHVPGFPGGASGKEPHLPTQVDLRDAGLIPGLGRSPREGHGNPL